MKKTISEYYKIKYAVAVSSGTDALHAAYFTLDKIIAKYWMGLLYG